MIVWFLTSNIGQWLMKIGAVAITVILVLAGAYRAGKIAQKNDELEARHKGMKRAKEIECGIARLPNGAAADELRRNWARG